jgi:hypothetical protein
VVASCNVVILRSYEMGFIKERIQSVISKKVAAVGIGLTLVDTWPQAAVIVAYLLAQAWSDALKDQHLS